MKKNLLFCLVVLIFMTGCSFWTLTGGNYRSEKVGFQADLPDGWRMGNSSGTLVLTRNGVELESISIQKMYFEDGFKNTKKKLSPNMLSFEIAELSIDDLKSQTNLKNLNIIENIPSKISEIRCYKLVYTYQVSSGLSRKAVEYGFIKGNYYYRILYDAPVRYYFEKFFPEFEKVKNSFKMIAPQTDLN